SWSQEKAYVTGLEAANLAIAHFGRGESATVAPIEPDEPHIQLARTINRSMRGIAETVLPNLWL
ncbi:MAG: amine oxidase, partial [Cyanobacteria bacterium P01_D01_bin.123]